MLSSHSSLQHTDESSPPIDSDLTKRSHGWILFQDCQQMALDILMWTLVASQSNNIWSKISNAFVASLHIYMLVSEGVAVFFIANYTLSDKRFIFVVKLICIVVDGIREFYPYAMYLKSYMLLTIWRYMQSSNSNTLTLWTHKSAH